MLYSVANLSSKPWIGFAGSSYGLSSFVQPFNPATDVLEMSACTQVHMTHSRNSLYWINTIYTYKVYQDHDSQHFTTFPSASFTYPEVGVKCSREGEGIGVRVFNRQLCRQFVNT